MVQKVNLADQLARFQELWSPKAVGAVNDFHVKPVKLKGEFVWHSHEVEDEHRPVADDEVQCSCSSRSRRSTRARRVARAPVRSSGSR